MSSKDEYPPLLQAGLHKMSLGDLKELVVDAFPLSDRRAPLWSNFVALIDQIKAVGLKAEIWVDGSYLTEKINPGDIDCVVDVPIATLDNPTQSQRPLLQKLASRGFRKPECLHTFVMFTAPAVHRDCPASVRIHDQWKKDFGFAYLSKEAKGIVIVEVAP